MTEKKPQRRKTTRVGVSLQVRVASESEEEFVEHFTTNVSKGGIFIQCREPKPKGTVVRFEIKLKGGEVVIRGRGEVVWTRTRDPSTPKPRLPGMGLKFLALDKKSKAIVRRILAIKAGRAPAPAPAGKPQETEQAEKPSEAAAPQEKREPPGEPHQPADSAGEAKAATGDPDAGAIDFDIDVDEPDDDIEVDISVADFMETAPPEEPPSPETSPPPEIPEIPEAPPTGPAGDVCIGIDLGTTNSCAAVVIDGKPDIVLTRKGYRTMPSVVSIAEDGRILVGQQARDQMELNPENTVYGAKRLIGRHYSSPAVQQMKDRFHYQIIPGAGLEPAVQLRGQVLDLKQISALLLREYRELAEKKLGRPVSRAVISVPAYYTENQRQAVREAGKLAGLTVDRIVNEPTAAALAYGYRKGLEKRMLVFDLGGGTFDASLLDLCEDVFEVVATGGDSFLGGTDFDNQLVDHVLNEFIRKAGGVPRMDRSAYQRLRLAAERAKCELSEQEETVIRIPHFGEVEGESVDLEVAVNRARLEMLTTPLVERAMNLVSSVVERAGQEKSQIDEIILVGGQTRMPLIWRRLEREFNRQPHMGAHPDEAVAVGATLLGNALGKIDSILLIDVLAVSIGYGTVGGGFRPVLVGGNSLPASVTFMIRTQADSQEKLQLLVFQGENDRILNNEYLGTATIGGITPAPRGKVQLKVTFALDVEGLLTVTASEHPDGRQNPVSFEMKHNDQNIRELLKIPEEETPSQHIGVPLSLNVLNLPDD